MRHQGRTAKLLRLPIGELSAWQLACDCSTCHASRVLLIQELVERFGDRATLVMLVPRLRCVVSRKPPSELVLRNRYPAQMGGPGLVEVQLV